MKLNPDCIRDILLWAEKYTDAGTYVKFERHNQVPEELSAYTKEVFIYHVNQCKNFGLVLYDERIPLTFLFKITDLSKEGHTFLANIRENANWNKTKKIANTIGTNSLDALKDIASNVISELIIKNFK